MQGDAERDPGQPATGLLRLKLGACLTGPTKRLAADLHAVARFCNVARNAMARAWLRWREDHPDWTPPPAVDKDGNPRLRRDGTPFLTRPLFPLKEPCPLGPDPAKPVSLETYLYHFGRRAAPELNSQLVSSCAKEVVSRLGAAMPYNHPGKACVRWQAVLAHEVNLDTYRALTIPVPNNSAAVNYCGISAGEDRLPAAVRQRLRTAGNSSCAVAFPLWSASSGRAWSSPVARLEVRQLSAGNRKVVRRVAAGEWKFRDSELVYVEDVGWCLHLTYAQPAGDYGLDAGRVAVLAPAPEADHPFTLTLGEKVWKVGHGPLLKSVFGRLDARRKAMRRDYGTAGAGRRGHGHSRNQRDTKNITRHVRHLLSRVAKQAAAEVVRFCLRFDCGTVEYREPPPYARQRTWFVRNGCQWDWNLFRAVLSHQLRRKGIALAEPAENRRKAE